MMLKHYMEEKQLDYNQPFLSARRFGDSPEVEHHKKADNIHRNVPQLPFYKSELKSGPLRKPGTVPFVWEQSPGRPKDENNSQSPSLGQPPVAPRLPPGRITASNKPQKPDKVFENPPVTGIQTENPRSSPSSTNVSSIDENAIRVGGLKNINEEKRIFCPENADEAYIDALDTLSQSESIYINCSVSGMSALDGLDDRQYGNFSADSQTRDFMMDRFLPAAKAIASETPQHTLRRQPKKVVCTDKQLTVYQSRPNPLPYYGQNYVEEESEGEDSEFGDHENLSGKACGFLPRFCLKNSFFVMNPVPAMRIGVNVPVVSVRRVRAKSYTGVCAETKFKERPIGETQKHEPEKDIGTLKGESKQTTHQNNFQKLDGSSLYQRLQGGVISPYQHNFSKSQCQSEKNDCRSNDADSHNKDHNSFRELLASQSNNWESGSSSPMVEKTLYIDSVLTLVSPNSNSSSDFKSLIDTRENDSEIPGESRDMEEFSSVDSVLHGTKHLSVNDENPTLQPAIVESFDSCLFSSFGSSNQEVKVGIIKSSHDDQELNMDSVSLEGPKLLSNSKINTNQWLTEIDNEENCHDTHPQLPLPPPLPKSPSDSWLCRTLPSVSSRNQSSRSFLGMHPHNKPLTIRKNTSDAKRENIVKTPSDVPRRHLQFSKDSLMPIPEN